MTVLARIRDRRLGRASALLVPVTGVEDLRAWTSAGLPAHVTVLYPFLRRGALTAAEIRRVGEVAAAARPFDYALAGVERFPGVLYLAPEPAGPFVALTRACVARWPDHPPFGGAYPEIVPHVTLAEGAEPAGLAEDAARRLPLPQRASELWLMEQSRAGWSRRAAFPLGEQG